MVLLLSSARNLQAARRESGVVIVRSCEDSDAPLGFSIGPTRMDMLKLVAGLGLSPDQAKTKGPGCQRCVRSEDAVRCDGGRGASPALLSFPAVQGPLYGVDVIRFVSLRF